MRISVKCSSAIHLLLIVAVQSDKIKVTSDYLASSIGSNPVEVRKLLSSLKKAGIIDVALGTGGTVLLKDPKDITLYDIYEAVETIPIGNIIGIHTHPTPQCPFGKNINKVLEEPYAEISDAVKQKMTEITLQKALTRLLELEPSLCE